MTSINRSFIRCAALFLLALSSQAFAGNPAQNFKELDDADWQLLSHSPGIMLGGQTPTAIQVVFDPDCPASARLFDYVRGKHPHTAMRWVPVAHYRTSSLGRAAALLRAPNPTQALLENFTRYDYSRQTGGVEPAADAVDVKIPLARMRQRLDRWIGATPLIVVRTPEGRVLMNQLGNRAMHIDRMIGQADGLKGYVP